MNISAPTHVLSDPRLSQEGISPLDVQRALLNLLEDSADEKSRLADMQSAVINILEDFDIQREAAEIGRIHVQQANSALESFSYSVAHDLRAPLRAIDGFSRILIEDHGEDLNSEGRRLLDIVVANVGAMGKLIDDLLAFSRLGRSELYIVDTDMTELVRGVDADLRSRLEPTREIDVEIEPLGRARCDPVLVRQVWINLLSNSIKFTKERTRAHVTVRRQEIDHETIYSVSDDGVGFEMQYVDKLFGVFQRLHSVAEFEGTGMGLAIVRRIVERHGGRIWATSGEGTTTFSFTLSRPGSK